MLFSSYAFLLAFLPFALVVYVALQGAPRRVSLAWAVLCSLVFYGWWKPAYAEFLRKVFGNPFIQRAFGTLTHMRTKSLLPWKPGDVKGTYVLDETGRPPGLPPVAPREPAVPEDATFELSGSATYAGGQLKHAQVEQGRLDTHGRFASDDPRRSVSTWSLTLVG